MGAISLILIITLVGVRAATSLRLPSLQTVRASPKSTQLYLSGGWGGRRHHVSRRPQWIGKLAPPPFQPLLWFASSYVCFPRQWSNLIHNAGLVPPPHLPARSIPLVLMALYFISRERAPTNTGALRTGDVSLIFCVGLAAPYIAPIPLHPIVSGLGAVIGHISYMGSAAGGDGALITSALVNLMLLALGAARSLAHLPTVSKPLLLLSLLGAAGGWTYGPRMRVRKNYVSKRAPTGEGRETRLTMDGRVKRRMVVTMLLAIVYVAQF